MKLGWVILATLMIATPAVAQTSRAPTVAAPPPLSVPTRVSGQTLTNLCAQDRTACLSYILGAADAFASALVAAGRAQAYCVPKGVTNDQIARSVVTYLRAHPEEAKTNAALIVLAGLKTAYPCGY